MAFKIKLGGNPSLVQFSLPVIQGEKKLAIPFEQKSVEDIMTETQATEERIKALTLLAAQKKEKNLGFKEELKGASDHSIWHKMIRDTFGKTHDVHSYAVEDMRLDAEDNGGKYRICIVKAIQFFISLHPTGDVMKRIEMDYVEPEDLIDSIDCMIQAFLTLKNIRDSRKK